MKNRIAGLVRKILGFEERKQVFRGVVRGIWNVSPDLSIIRLESIYDNEKEMQIPFYSELDGRYVGRNVDIVISRRGILSKKIKYEIYSCNERKQVEFDKRSIRNMRYSFPEHVKLYLENFCVQ